MLLFFIFILYLNIIIWIYFYFEINIRSIIPHFLSSNIMQINGVLNIFLIIINIYFIFNSYQMKTCLKISSKMNSNLKKSFERRNMRVRKLKKKYEFLSTLNIFMECIFNDVIKVNKSFYLFVDEMKHNLCLIQESLKF